MKLLSTIKAIPALRLRRLFREGSWILFGQAIGVLGSLVGVRLLTGLLDPAAYGELALGMTISTLVNQTLLGPLGGGVTRFYAPAVEQGDLGGYLNAVRRLVLSATGIIAIFIIISVTGLLVAGRAQWISIAIAALVFATLSGYNSILNGIQMAARQRSIVALHQGMESWLRFPLAAGLILLFGSRSTVAMVGYAIATIPVIASQWVWFRKLVPGNVVWSDEGKGWQEEISKFSWPYAIWGIFTWAQVASDRWALGLLATPHDVGLYAVVFQLGVYPISLATGMAMQLLAPILFQRAGDGHDSLRNANVNVLSWRLTGLSLGLTCVVFLFGFLFHAGIFRALAAKEYGGVSHLLPWAMLSGGVLAVGQTIELKLITQMKTRVMIAPKIITALLGVAFNFAGAYLSGIQGIIFARVLFSVLHSLWVAFLSIRTEGD